MTNENDYMAGDIVKGTFTDATGTHTYVEEIIQVEDTYYFNRGEVVRFYDNITEFIYKVERPEPEPDFDNLTSDEDSYTFIITEDTVTLGRSDGKTFSVGIGHASFDKAVSAVMSKDFEYAVELMDRAEAITSWAEGFISIKDGAIQVSGITITNKLADRIMQMMEEGDENFQHYARFLDLVSEQTSFTTRNRLMDFAATDQLRIDSDGMIIAFKNVKDDFTDKHSGTFDNSVGKVVEVDRKDVDDDHDSTCSNGLHVCSATYLKDMWGTSGRTMMVRVDPMNMVAVPHDYSDSKARVCKYEVIADVTSQIQDFIDCEAPSKFNFEGVMTEVTFNGELAGYKHHYDRPKIGESVLTDLTGEAEGLEQLEDGIEGTGAMFDDGLYD